MRVHAKSAATPTAAVRKPNKHEHRKAEKLGIRIEPGSRGQISADELNGVVKDVAKLPAAVRKTIRQGGSGIDLVGGTGITNHPLYKHLAGVKTPAKGDGDRTYDTVTGGGGNIVTPAVLAAEQLNPFGDDSLFSGSKSVALHESGHTFDALSGSLSDKKAWKKIHKKTAWEIPYTRQNKKEAFAESFSDYFYNKESRQSLPTRVKNYFKGVVDRLRGK